MRSLETEHVIAARTSRWVVSERKPYPSDLSDARWALIEPTLTAWRYNWNRQRASVTVRAIRPKSAGGSAVGLVGRTGAG